MIAAFVKQFKKKKNELATKFAQKHPDSYQDVVKAVIEILSDENTNPYGHNPDPSRIHCIDDGDYQGTLVFIIGATGYQPHNYWSVKVYYGSCSGCDTLQAISGYSDEPPTPEQVKDYMGLALNVVQGLRGLQEEGE
jgi:hypothetical protein